MRKRIELSAVLDKDLKGILVAHNLLEKFTSGDLRCKFCEEPLSWDNLGGFYVQDGKPILVCSSLDCIKSKVNR